ncbi:unnamed protein product, partial [Symbiodinium natans]
MQVPVKAVLKQHVTLTAENRHSQMIRVVSRVKVCQCCSNFQAMVLAVSVALLSGQCVSVEVTDEASINEVRQVAQAKMGRTLIALLSPFGVQLDPISTVAQSGLQDGTVLGAIAKAGPKLQHVFASMQAFAALRSDRRVVTWGKASHGGDSRHLAQKLVDVREIYSTEAAFAAVLGDRTVVTWGHQEQGGDCREIADELVQVRDIAASGKAFAAVRYDGTVVSWGHPEYGGDSSAVKDR